MINIFYPTPEQSIQYWDELYEKLSLGVARSNGEIDEATVKKQACDGTILFAVVSDDKEIIAVVGFEISEFATGKKVLNIQLAGGTGLDKWVKHMDNISQALAKAKGCTDVYIVGRVGWLRKLKNIGFEPVHTILHKEVL